LTQSKWVNVAGYLSVPNCAYPWLSLTIATAGKLKARLIDSRRGRIKSASDPEALGFDRVQ
jgi:hypothetical protein